MTTTRRTNVETDPIARATMSRKDLLRRAGVGAGALVAGSAATTMLGATPAAARVAAPAVHLGRRTYRVAWVGGTCEAFTYAAFAKHLWAHEGITVDLVHLTPHR